MQTANCVHSRTQTFMHTDPFGKPGIQNAFKMNEIQTVKFLSNKVLLISPIIEYYYILLARMIKSFFKSGSKSTSLRLCRLKS